MVKQVEYLNDLDGTATDQENQMLEAYKAMRDNIKALKPGSDTPLSSCSTGLLLAGSYGLQSGKGGKGHRKTAFAHPAGRKGLPGHHGGI